MAVTGETIRVEGLAPLLRSFQRMDPAMRRQMRRELLVIAEQVAVRARSFAVGQRLVDSGALADSIKPRQAGSTVAVVDTAKRVSRKYPQGYPYPKRYEFEGGGARAFMRPAVAEEAPHTIESLDRIFDRMVADSGFASGGLL